MTWNRLKYLLQLYSYGAKMIVFYMIIFFNYSCLKYSHTGSNLPDEVKTIKVGYFENFSSRGSANMGQDFTQDLQQFYQENTSLEVLSNGEADLSVEGEIVGYEISPIAPQTSTSASQFDKGSKTLLTITVNVRFVNSFNEEEDFEKNFSFKKEFDSSLSLDQVEDSLVGEITESIIQDIYNDTVANW